MTTLMMLAFVLTGLFGYRTLSVAALPRVDFPTIQVSANLPGASPETMASSVAKPLERQFSTIAGLTSITSLSSQGSTTVTYSSSSTVTSMGRHSTCNRRCRSRRAGCRRR